MQLFSAALVLLSATASMAFAPAATKTATNTATLMSATDDNCEDRRAFVSKVSFSTFGLEARGFNMIKQWIALNYKY